MDAFLDLRTITGLSGGDLERNHQTSGTFAPGQATLLHAATGLVIVQLVQNRGSVDLAQGDLTKLIGAHGRSAVSNVAVVAGALRTQFTTAGLTANVHIGAIAFVTGQGGAAPTGEYALVISNTATNVKLDPRRPLGADLAANDDFDLIATYQAERSSDSEETAAHAVPGVVVGSDGIDRGNFGFVQCFGLCPIARHDGGALNVNAPLLVSQATAGRLNESGAGGDANAIVAIAKGSAPDSAADTAVVHLACGPFAVGLTDVQLP